MAQPLHHVDSTAYGYLTPESIDFTLECVRDANEVLFANELLSARDMIVVARSVYEAEQLFAQDPRQLIERNLSPRSDWTLACAAEGLTLALEQLRKLERLDGVQQTRTELRDVLRRIAKSSLRSPVVSYSRVLSELIHQLPSNSALEQRDLLRLALVEDLGTQTQSNVMALLCQLGDCYVQLGMAEIALHVFLSLIRFDPVNVPVHQHLASSLQRSAPDLALAAAKRALLLLPRGDEHGLRTNLRATIEALSTQTGTSSSPFASALLAELNKPPGKRARIALRTLCIEIEPEISDVHEKEPEPLPDVAELAQLRAALRTFPLPFPAQVQRELDSKAPVLQRSSAIPASPTKASVGRNDLCPCGSAKKWKRCCGARKA